SPCWAREPLLPKHPPKPALKTQRARVPRAYRAEPSRTARRGPELGPAHPRLGPAAASVGRTGVSSPAPWAQHRQIWARPREIRAEAVVSAVVLGALPPPGGRSPEAKSPQDAPNTPTKPNKSKRLNPAVGGRPTALARHLL